VIIYVNRSQFTSESTIGRLSVDALDFCWTLEDPFRLGPKLYGETCIPSGFYDVTIDWSNRFQRRMPHILGIPGFDGVRLHWGNKAVNTLGCVMVGYTKAENFIGDSRHAFNDLFEKMDIAYHDGEPIYISIRESIE
jgi:Family of unknown function (DUF5675)